MQNEMRIQGSLKIELSFEKLNSIEICLLLQ